jgi:hypothetical protein
MHPDHGSPADRLDCAACRADAARGAGGVDLDRVWTGVAATVWVTGTGRVERVVRRLLRSPALARALVTTPSLVPSWLAASAAVLIIGTAVSLGVGTALVPLLAPALAGVGIAVAYGPGTDPAAELAATLPVSDRMVLLVRALAVFGVNAVMGVLAGLLSPVATGITWLWLVPMTAVSAVSLAAATLARSATVGTVVGLGAWSMTVLGTDLGTGAGIQAAASAHPLVPVYLLVTALGVAVVLINPTLPTSRNGRTL